MANGWIHSTIDLIAFGRLYFDIHKSKDEASKNLGNSHRTIDHEWFQKFGKEWNFDNPFPNFLKDMVSDIRHGCTSKIAEEQMAYWGHDYIDRIWDDLSKDERIYWEGFFTWVILNPDFLKDWAGVDVVEGKIKRLIDDKEVWETCLELKREYNRLVPYVKKVIKNDKELQGILERYPKMNNWYI